MFSNISWSTYFTGSIKERFSPPARPRMRMALPEDEDSNASAQGSLESESNEESGLDEYSDIENLIDRINSTIAGASEKGASPDEVKQYLKLLFSDFSALKNSPFRPSINELTASEFNKLGTVTLSEDEVDKLWDAV